MEFLIALLINLLIFALIVCVVFWVIDVIGAAFTAQPKFIMLIKAIIALIVLLWLLELVFGRGVAFYPIHPIR